MPSAEDKKRTKGSGSPSDDICKVLEENYLGECAHIPYDKYFHMLYAGMTKKEASMYTKEKLRRLNESHGLNAL